MLKCFYPEIETVVSAFLWLQGFPTTQKVFDVSTPEAVAKILAQFAPRLKEMKESERLGIYPAKPTGLCKQWCAVVTCPYNGKYKGMQ